MARAVGVCNFGALQLVGLKEAGLELPEVNQFEVHVWNQQLPTREYCKEKGIAVMAYCPLARCVRCACTVGVCWCLKSSALKGPVQSAEVAPFPNGLPPVERRRRTLQAVVVGHVIGSRS